MTKLSTKVKRRLIFGAEWIMVSIEDDSVLDILESISKEIQVVIDRIDDYPRDALETDAFVDSEFEKIEALLGVAFLICQVYINSVAEKVKRIKNPPPKTKEKDSESRSGLVKELKTALPNLPDEKWAILDKAPHVSDSICVSKVRAIYEAANYFKHSEEWPRNWDDVQGETSRKAQGYTQECMRQLGCKADSNKNLQTVFKRLGDTNYADLERIKRVVRDWGANILTEFKSALEHVRSLDEQTND